jgi:hypothetical protein
MRTCVVLLLAGCAPVFSGQLRVDGKPLVIETCRAGIAEGFAGVELGDARHGRLRVVSDALTGTAHAAWFPPEQTAGHPLGACATLEEHGAVGVINGVRNQAGTAVFACASGEHTVEGVLRFENCH